MIQDIAYLAILLAVLVGAFYLAGVPIMMARRQSHSVNQSNCVSGGDIVGGNLNIVSGRDTTVSGGGKPVRCAHCGALQ